MLQKFTLEDTAFGRLLAAFSLLFRKLCIFSVPLPSLIITAYETVVISNLLQVKNCQ